MSKYTDTVLADSPTTYLILDELAGSFVDSSGHGHTGTVASGSPTRGVTGASDTLGTGIKFHDAGSPDWITFTDGLGASAFSIEVWVKPEYGATNERYGAVGNGGVGSDTILRPNLLIGNPDYGTHGGDGYWTVELNNAVQPSEIDSFGLSGWHHLVFTYSNGATPEAHYYADGVEQAITAYLFSGPFVIDSTWMLGRYPLSTSGKYAGSMQHFALYGTALSAARVLAHYTAAFGADGGDGGDQGFDEYWDVLFGAGSDDQDTLTLHHTTHEIGGGDAVLGVWAYTFVAAAPATTWTIAHNLGGFPNVTLVDTSGVQIEAQITYDSDSQITVVFSSATQGTAYLT